MKPKLIIIFLLLVLSPLALLAWLGFRAAADEQSRVQSTITEAYANQLTSLRSLIHETITDREREFSQLLNPTTVSRTPALRNLVRTQRFVRQAFVITADGKFFHPPLNESLRTETESGFFDRTNSIWLSGERFTNQGESNWKALTQNLPNPAQTEYTQSLQDDEAYVSQQQAIEQTPAQYSSAAPTNFTTDQGWYTWFHGDGAQIIFWQHFPDTNTTAGIEVDREALMAEVIAKLPTDTGAGTGSIVLTDASARPIYQWGGAEPAAGATPDASIPLFAPLGMWHVNHHADGTVTGGMSNKLLPLIASVTAAAFALLALAIYFYRENSREMRIAAEKVSFVNQVSHELKTPLTNIRMYAELAEQKLPEQDNGAQRCLDIVVNESQRLSRLIGNVLTFAKPKAQQPNATPNIPDDLIRETLDHFRPALAAQKIEIDFQLGAKQPANIDPDFLEQILGNLLSNVEKYAASGGHLRITSTQSKIETTITVADQGPGIPKNQRGKIFRPFHRLSNKNSDGVSGTGIGLTIARDLARKHGGDLTLSESKTTPGCCFTLTLRTTLTKRTA
ncbi:MAG: signal transduction histidine kinase [Verrucomicrobiales bacterium]